MWRRFNLKQRKYVMRGGRKPTAPLCCQAWGLSRILATLRLLPTPSVRTYSTHFTVRT
jgi:hypothetical protein